MKKKETSDRVPKCKQSYAVISQTGHTDYEAPQEPSIKTWNHFLETKEDLLRLHLENEGTIPFEPECSNDCLEYTFAALVALQAQAAGGLLLTAPAGTGKTWLARRVAKHLTAAGHKVCCMAPTHVAARLCGGRTIAHVKH